MADEDTFDLYGDDPYGNGPASGNELLYDDLMGNDANGNGGERPSNENRNEDFAFHHEDGDRRIRRSHTIIREWSSIVAAADAAAEVVDSFD
ncbi:hypothetical protein HK102_007682 [Quaeritorhiza haematococci]|nr:hypothetical protein HK102_007682 [Quaeritorhiza haematococci]